MEQIIAQFVRWLKAKKQITLCSGPGYDLLYFPLDIEGRCDDDEVLALISEFLAEHEITVTPKAQ